MDLSEALATLPHGPEFRFLDRLIDLQGGRSGTGEYQVKGSESFLAGHFPGQPLFPGVLLVEAAAQLAGVIAQTDPATVPMRNLRLTGVRAIKILDTAGPGETLRISARISGRLAGLVQADVAISCAGRQLLTGSIVLSGNP